MTDVVAPTILAPNGTTSLLRRRMVAGLWLILVATAIFAVADLGIPRDRFVVAYPLKALHAALLLGLLLWLRTPRSDWATWLGALVAVNGTYALMAAGDLAKGHLATTPLLCVTINMGAAALLPWGVRAQLVTLAFTGLGNLVVLAQMPGPVGSLIDPAASVVVAQIAAVYVAYELDRFRIERGHVERQLAERASTEALRADVRLALGEHQTRSGQLEASARAIAHQLAAEVVWIWTRTGAGWRLEAAAGTAADARQVDRAPAPGTARALERLARQTHPFFTDEIDVDRSPLIPPALRGGGRTGMAALPLAGGEDALGALYVATRTTLSPIVREALAGVATALTSGLARLEAEESKARLVTALEQANRLKSEFVSTMSHELRTPLNVIMGYTDMLADPDYKDPAFALARIRHANHELLELIEATLDLNRLESGRDEPQLEEVSLAELWQELAGEFDTTVTHARVAVDWGVESGASLRTDRRKLKIIMKNLVGNAVKFTPEGSIRVRARCEDGTCVVEVRDTGIGIAEAALPSIFEMFQQADSSDRRSYGGVGLGLHIVRRLGEQLGASIDVESRVGLGSCFTLRLPTRGPAVYAA
jgi:signal transduction histidine kinase